MNEIIRKELYNIATVVVQIYVLEHPVTGIPFYAGKTVLVLRDRLKGHISDAKHRKHVAQEVILAILKEGLRPVIRLLEEVQPGEDWCIAEKKWIRWYRERWPETMCNHSDGGQGPSCAQSEESNLKRKNTMLLTRDKQSEDQRNRWLDENYRINLTKAMTERGPFSQSHLENLRRTTKETWQDPDIRKKRADNNRAAQNEPEYAKHRSQLQTEKWANQEYRAMMAKSRADSKEAKRLAALTEPGEHVGGNPAAPS